MDDRGTTSNAVSNSRSRQIGSAASKSFWAIPRRRAGGATIPVSSTDDPKGYKPRNPTSDFPSHHSRPSTRTPDPPLSMPHSSLRRPPSASTTRRSRSPTARRAKADRRRSCCSRGRGEGAEEGRTPQWRLRFWLLEVRNRWELEATCAAQRCGRGYWAWRGRSWRTCRSAPRGEVIVSVRPGWRERDCCGICRRRSPGFDLGEGRWRWRARDRGVSWRTSQTLDTPVSPSVAEFTMGATRRAGRPVVRWATSPEVRGGRCRSPTPEWPPVRYRGGHRARAARGRWRASRAP